MCQALFQARGYNVPKASMPARDSPVLAHMGKTVGRGRERGVEASLGHWAQRLWGKLMAKESCQVRPWGHCGMRVPVGWAQMHAPLGSSAGQATAFQCRVHPRAWGPGINVLAHSGTGMGGREAMTLGLDIHMDTHKSAPEPVETPALALSRIGP